MLRGPAPPVRRASETEYDGSEYRPQWSRSGREVAFLREEQSGTNLVVVEVGTGTERTVTESGEVTQGFSWTPDERLVYVDGDSTRGDLFDVAADGSDRRQLTDDDIPKFTPEVSPDGERVVYGQGTPR